MTLANPLGLWALLGIPAVLAIHFLQRKATVLPISTLFLLEKTQRESASGRRFDRLMNSVPLWMQLLAVLIITWLLCEPRFQRPRSVQRVAIVLDSSASMSVFKDRVGEELASLIPDLRGAAAALELSILESNGRRLYAGDSLEDALAALEPWQPRDGTESPTRSLQIARSLVGADGSLVFATDTPVESLPFDTTILAVGEPIENVGVAGFDLTPGAEGATWRAIVRNYSDRPVTREWQLRFPDGRASKPAPIDLEAGALVSISGKLPAEVDRARLVLSPDQFTLDDEAPMIVPARKALTLFSSTSPAFDELAERLAGSLDAIEPVDNPSSADLSLVSYDPLDPGLPEGNAIVFVDDATRMGAYLKGGIVAEKHPLIDDLNWQSLLVRETIQLERLASDEVILWQDTRPLIFIRTIPREGGQPARQLCFNFDLRRSNAATQPAFIVALHRFAESIRSEKVAPSRQNLESSQPIRLAVAPGEVVRVTTRDLSTPEEEKSETLKPAQRLLQLKAPPNPFYLSVKQGDLVLLDAAVHFADTREADFSECASTEGPSIVSAASLERHTDSDPWWRIWALLLFTALLIAWHFVASPEVPSSKPPEKAPAT